MLDFALAKGIVEGAWGCLGVNEDRLALAMLTHRNTPTMADGYTPAQKVLSCDLADRAGGGVVRCHNILWEEVVTCRIAEAACQQACYDRGTCSLACIPFGSRVLVQDATTGR